MPVDRSSDAPAGTDGVPAVPSRAAAERRARPQILPHLDSRELTAIFAGGAVGTVLRAALAQAFRHSPTAWPWPTFAANLAAAFLLGYAATRLQERLPLSNYRRPLLGTGLCGGLSTFSTMQVELVRMLDAHDYGIAIAYAAASVVAGFLAVYTGVALVRRAWSRW